jgi:pyruvate kinase
MVKRQLELVYGAQPVYMKRGEASDVIRNAAEILKEKELVKENDLVLFTAGVRTRQLHESNLIEIHRIADLIGAPTKKQS